VEFPSSLVRTKEITPDVFVQGTLFTPNSKLTKRRRRALWNINSHVCPGDVAPPSKLLHFKLTLNHIVFGLFAMLMSVFVFALCYSYHADSGFLVKRHSHRRLHPQNQERIDELQKQLEALNWDGRDESNDSIDICPDFARFKNGDLKDFTHWGFIEGTSDQIQILKSTPDKVQVLERFSYGGTCDSKRDWGKENCKLFREYLNAHMEHPQDKNRLKNKFKFELKETLPVNAATYDSWSGDKKN